MISNADEALHLLSKRNRRWYIFTRDATSALRTEEHSIFAHDDPELDETVVLARRGEHRLLVAMRLTVAAGRRLAESQIP